MNIFVLLSLAVRHGNALQLLQSKIWACIMIVSYTMVSIRRAHGTLWDMPMSAKEAG